MGGEQAQYVPEESEQEAPRQVRLASRLLGAPILRAQDTGGWGPRDPQTPGLRRGRP